MQSVTGRVHVETYICVYNAGRSLVYLRVHSRRRFDQSVALRRSWIDWGREGGLRRGRRGMRQHLREQLVEWLVRLLEGADRAHLLLERRNVRVLGEVHVDELELLDPRAE